MCSVTLSEDCGLNHSPRFHFVWPQTTHTIGHTIGRVRSRDSYRIAKLNVHGPKWLHSYSYSSKLALVSYIARGKLDACKIKQIFPSETVKRFELMVDMLPNPRQEARG